MIRLNMSRPKLSVPKGCAAEGGESTAVKSMATGSAGAMRRAKTPAASMSRMATSASAPRGCARANDSSPRAERRKGAFPVVTSSADMPGLAVADARIEHRVEQVDGEIHQHGNRGDEHDQALHQSEVVARHRLDEELAQAVEVEHLLGHHQAADEEGDFQPDDRRGRQERVAQRVAADDDALAHAFGARRADIVLVHHLDDGAAHHARDYLRGAVAYGQRRPDELR